MPVTGDFDGDGYADGGVYDAVQGQLHLLMSSDGYDAYTYIKPNMIPVTGDFDGDGCDDTGCYDNGSWYLMLSRDGAVLDAFGFAGAVPVNLAK